jgi:predicted O-methyltransferase YrrM
MDMPNLKTALRIFGSIVANPRRLARVIDSPPLTPKELTQRYFSRQSGLPQIDLLELLPDLDETISPYSYLEGQALPTDIALLKGLARKRPACRYLEIGSWRGESLANVASVSAECVAITLAADEMREAGYPETAIANEGFFSQGLGNVRLIKHNSRTMDYGPFANYFDLVFIDGDHAPEAVASDTKVALGLLRNNDSVIVWHDYGLTPESVNWGVLEGIRAGCSPDEISSVFHVSNTLCAVFIRSHINSRYANFPQFPDKAFDLHLRARRLP